MLDPKQLRRDILKIALHLQTTRGFQLDIETLQRLESERKILQQKVQNLQNESNGQDSCAKK